MTNVTRLCAIVFPLKYHIHATSIKGKIVCAVTLVLTVVFTITGECYAKAADYLTPLLSLLLWTGITGHGGQGL